MLAVDLVGVEWWATCGGCGTLRVVNDMIVAVIDHVLHHMSFIVKILCLFGHHHGWILKAS